jgi:hypothetical protein
MFGKCASMNSPPNWGNTYSQIAQYLSAMKALAANRRITKEERDLAAAQLIVLVNQTLFRHKFQDTMLGLMIPVSPLSLPLFL